MENNYNPYSPQENENKQPQEAVQNTAAGNVQNASPQAEQPTLRQPEGQPFNQTAAQSGGYMGSGPMYQTGHFPGVQPAFRPPSPQQGWSPYNTAAQYTGTQQAGGYGGFSGQGATSQSPASGSADSGKKKGGGMRLVATLVACAVLGVGGGFLGASLAGNSTSVVYKAAEPNEATSASVNEGASISDIASKAGQSVVSVITENVMMDQFFTSRIVEGAGSGVIMSEDGFIITNAHVISGARSVTVTLPDGSAHKAAVIGSDERTDIAVIKIGVTGLVPAVMSDSANLNVGDFCIAIGNPLGSLGGTVTDGIISAKDREVTVEGQTMTELLQMSAAVSPGNSGGGLFNNRGELIGVVNAKSIGQNAEGLGFAIPVNKALEIAEQLIENGYVAGRPALGINAEQMIMTRDGISTGQTVVRVASVNPGGSADNAGIKEGDILLSFNGTPIATLSELTSLLDEQAVGSTVDVEIMRGEEKLTLQVTLQELLTQSNVVA